MELDWITVSAQIVNFLVLVWLLKRFLYRPVIQAMDGREQRIADRLGEAEARERQADEAKLHYVHASEALENERDAIVSKAREEAQEEKQRMLDGAREEVAETRKHWQRQTDQEKEEFLKNLQKQVLDAVQAIARRALIDLADTEIEKQIVHSFVDKLRSLDRNDRKAIAESSGPVRIASAFDIDSATRSHLTRAVHEHLVRGVEVEYLVLPELACGIELTIGGRQLGWSLARYLEELTLRVEQAFAAVPTGE